MDWMGCGGETMFPSYEYINTLRKDLLFGVIIQKLAWMRARPCKRQQIQELRTQIL